MKEQSQRRAGVVRPTVLAINIVRQKHCFHFFGFVMTIQKIAKASREERKELRNFFALHPAKSFSHAQQFEPSRRSVPRRIRWWFQEKRLQITRQFFQLLVPPYESVRIARRQFTELSDGVSAVGPPGHDLPIRKRHQQARIAGHHFQSSV